MSTPNIETVKLDELNAWRIRHNGAATTSRRSFGR
jgi:glucose-6-phosphate 1-epimerase